MQLDGSTPKPTLWSCDTGQKKMIEQKTSHRKVEIFLFNLVTKWKAKRKQVCGNISNLIKIFSEFLYDEVKYTYMLPQLHSKNWKKLTMTALAQPNAVIKVRWPIFKTLLSWLFLSEIIPRSFLKTENLAFL